MKVTFVKQYTEQEITYEFGAIDFEGLVFVVEDYPDVRTIYGQSGSALHLIADKKFINRAGGQLHETMGL